MSTPQAISRAWREPMMWLVAGIPLATVIASVWLLVMLSRGPSVDVVRDEVQRVSQAQVTDLGPDEAAQQLGLKMLLSVVPGSVELRGAGGALPDAAPLRLVLAHPLDAGQDRELLLEPSGEAWRAQGTWSTDHDWNLVLSPVDGRWRLTGRLVRNTQAAILQPALVAP